MNDSVLEVRGSASAVAFTCRRCNHGQAHCYPLSVSGLLYALDLFKQQHGRCDALARRTRADVTAQEVAA